MKVKLINVAEYEIKDGKVSEIPFESFVNLCGGVGANKVSENLPNVRLFKTMGEFISLSADEIDNIDQSESIKVLPNGQFLVFLKGNGNKEKTSKSTKSNATANTEEDKGEKA